MHYAFHFVLAVFAVWRVTHMLAREDGPWDVLSLIRRKMGSGVSGRLMNCFYCLTLWVALPFSFFLKGDAAETAVGWLALSGTAILLERAAQPPLELKIEEDAPWDVAAKR